ncbi:biopolymer transporter ExbD [Cupriavidus sp. AU9028]|uniref:ExbD/TolR family protein n=1 Tax=Cupriavidus sp. AU9028 TaxID=2871157 RepID=UPI001C944926|nr:biopolymer transporter ExbD [Cupriavidus sp. AU9028]MBY4895493.1 biopolymer transporter ExbD [Cupriavidus sp. AU9028]
MQFRPRQRRDEPEINLIPLIDVLLVILIFLMITTTYARHTELRIALPFANAQEPQRQPEPIVVSVSAKGTVAIQRDTFEAPDVAALTARLRALSPAQGEAPAVVIHADAQASHQSVVNVMEAARLAGLSRLTFATRGGSPR